MATHAMIVRELENGKFESVFLWYGDTPDITAKKLLEHYQEKEKVEELFKHGSIYSLEGSVEKPSDEIVNDKFQNTHTIFYGRDLKKEGDQYKKKMFNSEKDMLDWAENTSCMFVYYYSDDNLCSGWMVKPYLKNHWFLDIVIAEIAYMIYSHGNEEYDSCDYFLDSEKSEETVSFYDYLDPEYVESLRLNKGELIWGTDMYDNRDLGTWGYNGDL